MVVALTGMAGLVLLTGLDSASGVDDAVESSGLTIAWPPDDLTVVGCFAGAIISQDGSVGLDGSEEEDIGRRIVIWELHHSPPKSLGE